MKIEAKNYNLIASLLLTLVVVFILSTPSTFAIIGFISTAFATIVSFFDSILGSTLLDLANLFFELALGISVFNLTTLISLQEGSVIPALWKFIRDLTNVIITAYFIFTAVQLSTGQGNAGSQKKRLVWLLIAALLVNFSGFITLVILDLSNLIAAFFYNSLSLNTEGFQTQFTKAQTTILGEGVADRGIFFLQLISLITKFLLSFALFSLTYVFLQRVISAVILLLGSPIAILGACLKFVGGDSDEKSGKIPPLLSQTSKVYDKWKEEMLFVFMSPIIIFLGLSIILKLYSETVTILGANAENGTGIILHSFASILLFLGILKVIEFTKFKGENNPFTKKVAESRERSKTRASTYRNYGAIASGRTRVGLKKGLTRIKKYRTGERKLPKIREVPGITKKGLKQTPALLKKGIQQTPAAINKSSNLVKHIEGSDKDRLETTIKIREAPLNKLIKKSARGETLSEIEFSELKTLKALDPKTKDAQFKALREQNKKTRKPDTKPDTEFPYNF